MTHASTRARSRLLTWAAVFLIGLTAGLIAGSQWGTPGSSPQSRQTVEDGLQVFFSPQGGAQAAIIERIHAAQERIDLALYSFTARPIAEALVAAQKRGVAIRVVLDRSQAGSQYSAATFLHNQGMAVWISRGSGIMHHKFALIDGRVLINGSKNWSANAEERNAENVMVFEGYPGLILEFEQEFTRLLAAAEPYQR